MDGKEKAAKEKLQNQAATNIAYAMRNIIEENDKKNEHPFVVGWEDKSSDLTKLRENIERLYQHPRANAELLYFLNRLSESYYI